MKEELIRIVRETENNLSAWNRAREYLQARILGLLQETGAMIPLAFCGGTALRFLYSLPRFSEDLDFSLEGKSNGFHLESSIERVVAGLSRSARDRTVGSGHIAARRPSLYGKLVEPIAEVGTRDVRNRLTGHTIK